MIKTHQILDKYCFFEAKNVIFQVTNQAPSVSALVDVELRFKGEALDPTKLLDCVVTFLDAPSQLCREVYRFWYLSDSDLYDDNDIEFIDGDNIDDFRYSIEIFPSDSPLKEFELVSSDGAILFTWKAVE